MPLFHGNNYQGRQHSWPRSHGRTIKLLTLLQMLTISSKERMTMFHCQQKGKGSDAPSTQSGFSGTDKL